jgi:PAS domain S-box-containing protein
MAMPVVKINPKAGMTQSDPRGKLSKEEALRESERRFRALVEGSLTGISIVQDDQVVYQNPEMERLLGPLPRSSKLADISSIHPDDAAKVEAFYQRSRADGPVTDDIDFRFSQPGGMRSGGGLKWVNCRLSPIRYQGRDALLVNMMDITQIRQMEHLLRIQDKMTSLGRVAAGIAHEIRNPLSGVNIYLDTLEKRLSEGSADERTAKILGQLRSASQKIESVIKRVMDFARPGRPRLVVGDLNAPIREAVHLSRASLRKNGIRFELRLARRMPPCRLDPQLIEEVLLNLITNAADALKVAGEAKTIRITTRAAGDKIRVVVSDSGPGIPPSRLEAIFDPFYTTKRGSTGIGLNLSRRIIADHGGTLTAGNRRGGGGRFVIDLPTADASSAP